MFKAAAARAMQQHLTAWSNCLALLKARGAHPDARRVQQQHMSSAVVLLV